MQTYTQFIEAKRQRGCDFGVEPENLPDFLYDFQRHLVAWAIKKGRGAIYADCGLGKTPMQLAWADHMRRVTNKPVMIITPLAVSQQTEREAAKFGIEAGVSREGEVMPGITITNFERLHYFDHNKFGAIVVDESSAIKNFNGKTKKTVTEFMREIPYRLLCTATAAPNDFIELGTSSEALGYMGYQDMLTKFFAQEVKKDYLGWGRAKYRFRGHAEHPFWRWVCSWARAIKKPSDLGFDDTRFELPPLLVEEVVVKDTKPRDGHLFSMPARTLGEQREERRNTIQERCETMADRITSKPTVVWCHYNDEADLLARLIPNSQQVSGSMSNDSKERTLLDFSDGSLPCLITKPKIGCWGLNWQHCSDVFMFPSHSFEQYYQAIRRCWRFGQESPVNVTVVTTEGEIGVMRNLKRKQDQAEKMFTNLIKNMNDELTVSHAEYFPETETVPSWL